MSLTVTEGVPQYRAIYEQLRSKACTVGHKGVRIGSYRDISKEFRVGQSTVVRAINMLKKDGFAYGRQGKGTYICDRKRESSKLQQIDFYTYCIDIGTIRYSRGFERVFGDSDYSVSIHSSYMSMKRYKKAIEHIGRNGSVGIILFNPSLLDGTADAIDTSFLSGAGIPVVTMGCAWPDFPCDRVEHTRRDSAIIMAEHAIAGGCQNPGIFLRKESGSNTDNEDFLDEFKRSFKQHNIEIKKENIFYFDVPNAWIGPSDIFMDAYQFTKKEFARVSKCDTLMFHTDGSATGALRALRENGIKVPEQIKLLSGFRGADPEVIREKPTTVDTNIEQQACVAAELLKRRIEGYDGPVEAHYVSGRLVEGSTT